MKRPARREPPLLRLYHELARRHVVRVAVGYLVAAWIVLQVSSTLLPAMGIGETGLRWVLVLLAAGLPAAVVLSWYYDITPDGLRLTGSAEDMPRRLGGTDTDAGAAPDRNSLAVLAFADRSEGRDQEFLAKGISEELTNLLGRVGGLRIASRSSAFAFEGKALDVREIGRHLRVAHVLDGSVRKSGDRLRIAVELIDVVDGYSKWMNTYDRDTASVFGVQEEIARSIVAEIRPQLLGADAAALRLEPGTTSADAYDAYLKGRHYWNTRYAVGLEKSIQCFGQAAELDPNYALPLSGLADAWSLLGYYNFVAPRDAFARAGEYARRAHVLDSTREETNSSLAFVQQFFDWNFAAAESSFRKALERNPGYGPARFWFAYLQATLGRPDEALAQIRAARAAEPFSPIIHGGASYLDYLLGRYREGIEAATEVLAADPNFGPAHMFLGFLHIAVGDHDAAVRSWQSAVERLDRMLFAHVMLATAFALAGDRTEARRRLLVVDNGGRGYVSPYHRGAAALALGETDSAIEHLERALLERSPFLTHGRLDPLMRGLHADPRYRRIMEQVGLPLAPAASSQRTA
ncbi:MAG: tetratricopeptide repeat protein [Steroidobacteraceae bacterium]